MAAPLIAAPSWPIKASSNNRYLVDQNGTPFLMVIDAAHHLMPALPQASLSTYLSDRVTNQFNTIDVYAICTGGTCGSTMAAQDGTLPFTTGTSPSNFDVTTPNATYWAEVDNVITTAANDGLTVLLFACPWGNGCSTMLNNGVNTSAKIFAYGQFLGNRYKNFTNIVWAMGDDLDQSALPSAATLALNTHLAAGILSNDPNHLLTYQLSFNESYAQQAKNICSNPSTCFTEFGNTLTLSNTYDYFELYDYSIQEWLATPTLPAILTEANYETANNTGGLTCTAGGGVLCPEGSTADPFIIREQMWWPVTSGTIGGFEFGNAHVSHFDGGGVWNANLDTTATLQVKYVNQLLSRLPWWTLTPECTASCATSGNHALVSAGYGTYNGANLNLFTATYASGAFDGSKYAVIYAPVSTTLTLKMSAFSGTTSVYWYDPTTGNFSTIAGSPFTNTGTHTFTTPGAHSDGTGRSDWVLVAAPSSCPANVPSGVTTCYFVAANGSDSNDGRSEVAPWLYSPGMNSCASACLTKYNSIKAGGAGTGAAGVGLIFRGGDTWHFGNSGASPYAGNVSTCAFNGTTAAGLCFDNFQASSGSPFYAGVDTSWYTGTSWARPILTADNSLCNSGTLGTMPDGATCSNGTDPTGRGQATYVVSSCPYQVGGANVLVDIGFSKYITVDNFEMVGLCAKTVGQINGADLFMNTAGEQGPNNVTNNYIHGDSHLQYAFANSSASCTSSVMCFDMYVFNGVLGAGTVGNTIQNNVIDFADSDPAGTGLCAPGTTLYNFSYNVVRYNSQCIPKNVDVVHDNLFEFYYENGHSNLWEDADQGPTAAYYNNVFRHLFGALVFWPGANAVSDSAYFFNNVTYDVTTSQYLDYGGTGVSSNAGTYFVFNNTFQSNGSSSTVIACSSTPSVPFKNTNNHFVNDVGSFPASGCAGMTNLTPLSMSNATATGDGYTSAQTFGYSPISSGSPTVSAGTNEYSGYCSALLASADALIQAAGTACRADTTYGVSYNSTTHTVSSPSRTALARPTSAAWDSGAYQFSSLPQASTPTFSPVAGTYQGTQSITISTTSAGAIICYNAVGSPATNGTSGCTTGSLYVSPVSVPASETIYAVAGGTGYNDSSVGSAAYTINTAPASSAGLGSGATLGNGGQVR